MTGPKLTDFKPRLQLVAPGSPRSQLESTGHFLRQRMQPFDRNHILLALRGHLDPGDSGRFADRAGRIESVPREVRWRHHGGASNRPIRLHVDLDPHLLNDFDTFLLCAA